MIHRPSVLMPLGYSVLMLLRSGILMALEQGVLMTLGYSVHMKQEQGVLLPLGYSVLPFHKVMNRYELLWAIGIFLCCTFVHGFVKIWRSVAAKLQNPWQRPPSLSLFFVCARVHACVVQTEHPDWDEAWLRQCNRGNVLEPGSSQAQWFQSGKP